MRLLLHTVAYILHQQLRTRALRHTALFAGTALDGHRRAVQDCRAGQAEQKQDRRSFAERLPGQTSSANVGRTDVSADAWQDVQLFPDKPCPARRELTTNPLTLPLLPRF